MRKESTDGVLLRRNGNGTTVIPQSWPIHNKDHMQKGKQSSKLQSKGYTDTRTNRSNVQYSTRLFQGRRYQPILQDNQRSKRLRQHPYQSKDPRCATGSHKMRSTRHRPKLQQQDTKEYRLLLHFRRSPGSTRQTVPHNTHNK